MSETTLWNRPVEILQEYDTLVEVRFKDNNTTGYADPEEVEK